MKPVLVFLFAMVSQPTFARLGETLDECKWRYGSPTGQLGADEITFYRGHVGIVVHLRGGRSIREDFAPEAGATLSANQIANLLSENSEGSVWEIAGETPTYTTHSRKDGRATAQVAKPNSQGDGNIKLTATGAEVIVKYGAAAARDVAPAK
jgi:hypothetical protein